MSLRRRVFGRAADTDGVRVGDGEEDELKEIDPEAILPSRTRGVKIDFQKADKETPKEDGDDDEDDDEDFDEDEEMEG